MSEYVFSYPVSKFLMSKYAHWEAPVQKEFACEDFGILKLSDAVVVTDSQLNEGIGRCVVDSLKNKNILIILNNGGGSLAESFIISSYVKEKKIDVYLMEECGSACINILVSSDNPRMCEKAILGIHQAYTNNSINWLEPYLKKASNEMALSHLIENGVNEKFIRKAFEETPSEKIKWIDANEALNNNFIIEEVDCEKEIIY